MTPEEIQRTFDYMIRMQAHFDERQRQLQEGQRQFDERQGQLQERQRQFDEALRASLRLSEEWRHQIQQELVVLKDGLLILRDETREFVRVISSRTARLEESFVLLVQVAEHTSKRLDRLELQ